MHQFDVSTYSYFSKVRYTGDVFLARRSFGSACLANGVELLSALRYEKGDTASSPSSIIMQRFGFSDQPVSDLW